MYIYTSFESLWFQAVQAVNRLEYPLKSGHAICADTVACFFQLANKALHSPTSMWYIYTYTQRTTSVCGTYIHIHNVLLVCGTYIHTYTERSTSMWYIHIHTQRSVHIRLAA